MSESHWGIYFQGCAYRRFLHRAMYRICRTGIPVFGMGGGLGSVKRRKALRIAFFHLRGFESYGGIFSVPVRLVTGFVRIVSCICADFFFLTQLARFENGFVHF